MAKYSVSLPDDLADDLEAIREAMGEEDPLGDEPDRSRLIQEAVRDWVAKNEEYLEGDTGNRAAAIATAD